MSESIIEQPESGIVREIADIVLTDVVKRPRGRPRKIEEPAAAAAEGEIKRGRGRPRKYPVIVGERGASGTLKPVMKKVESGYLLKHMFQYFTKLLVLHHELSQETGKAAVVFHRLKSLDFQMVQVCKTILSKEFILAPDAQLEVQGEE